MPGWTSCSLAAALACSAPAPASAAPSTNPAVPESASTIGVVVVDATSVDTALRDEIALRSAGREVVTSDEVTSVPAVRFAWAGVEWIADDEARLRLVVSDGRAYSRSVTAPAAQLPRAVAGVLANMLAAIEQDAIVPEDTGVAVPLPAAAPRPPTTTPAPTPVAASPVGTPAIREVRRASWGLGPHVTGVAMFGLGPPTDLDGFSAAGAAIGVDAVHRRGGLATIAVRVATHARDGVRLVRTRVAVAGGWAWRRRSFELLSRVGVSVEPTIVRDRGRSTVTTAPLVGVLASLAPAFVWWSARGTSGLRIGLDLEIAASMEARARPGVLRWLDATSDGVTPLLRAGGLELSAGLGVGGWFALGRGRLRP